MVAFAFESESHYDSLDIWIMLFQLAVISSNFKNSL